MTPLREILAWVASHSSRLSRAGYTAPNHLANGEMRWLATDGTSLFAVTLDDRGNAPKDYDLVTLAPDRIEIRSRDGELLFTEQA